MEVENPDTRRAKWWWEVRQNDRGVRWDGQYKLCPDNVSNMLVQTAI